MKKIRQFFLGLTCLLAVGVIVEAISALGAVSPPLLSIQALGTNQFSINIVNAGITNYTLFWTPVLEDPNYPWLVLTNSNPGQSNFVVDGGTWPAGFFRVLVGNDIDGDGVVEWQDAQPTNSAVGILSVTIDNPLNGTTFN